MNITSVLRVALRALRRNIGRSLLTALGIIIGIAAVIVVVAVGQGASSMMQAQISSMGSNLVMVFPGSTRTGGFHGGTGSQQTLTAADGEALMSISPYVTAISPVVRSGSQIVYRENDWATSIMGVNTLYLDIRAWPIAEGAGFFESDVRSGARVCVLGTTVAEKLFGSESPVGKTIRIRRMPFQVLGVLSRKGSSTWGQDQDDTVIAPWTTVRRVLEKSSFNNVNMLIVSLTSMDALVQAREDITGILRERHRLAADADDDFTIRDMTELSQMMTQVSSLMTILLTAIASISLLVGGIGIMNIMLVSVTERTREIGLRMAVGARRRDILMQFLVEAIVLSGTGGLVGIGVGVAGAYIVATANNWPVLISAGSIAMAILFSAGVGIFFGFYPAWRASKLDPIESLRRE